MSKREMAEVGAPRKGEWLWMEGKPYRYGHTYKVAYASGVEYVGTLTWGAVPNPKPSLHIAKGFSGEPEIRRPEFWSMLTYVSE